MRGVRNPLLVAVFAALLIGGLIACGGDDSGSDPADGTQQSTAQDAASDQPNAVFFTPGGDNSVQTFGEEASAADRKAASVALFAYMQARAEADWATACANLTRYSVRLLSSAKPSVKVCAKTYATLIEGIPAAARANTMVDGIASLRVEGNRAFALYHGTKGADYFSPMRKEGDEWKVEGLEPNEFP